MMSADDDPLGLYTCVDECGLSASIVDVVHTYGCRTLGQVIKKLEVLEEDLSSSEAEELRRILRPTS